LDTNVMSLTEIARHTLKIIENGRYVAGGVAVELRGSIDDAVRRTRLYAPDEVAKLVVENSAFSGGGGSVPTVEVTGETTAAACRRLVSAGVGDVLALNFASAKNPGGGFVSGAKAQEEDLARCSALYACQVGGSVSAYYAANRASRSLLYTDHLIYSPRVPFFRDEALELIADPFHVSVITSPAPNAGEARRGGPGATSGIRETLRSRGAHVLAVARANGHRTLVLGAWGCGVFRNDPKEVADMFAGHLAAPGFAPAFDRVVFAVYDRSKDQANRRAFDARFGGAR
jgi:uncharacterized protein (TIGR02452 family)